MRHFCRVQPDTLQESRRERRKGDTSLALGGFLAVVGLATAGWGLAAPFFEDRSIPTAVGFGLFGLGLFEMWYGWTHRKRGEELERRALGAAAPPAPTPGPKFCRMCGAGVGDAAHFCGQCGAKLA